MSKTKIDQIIENRDRDRLSQVPIEYQLSIDLVNETKQQKEDDSENGHLLLKYSKKETAIDAYNRVLVAVALAIHTASDNNNRSAVVKLLEAKAGRVVESPLLFSSITNKREE